VHVIYTTATHKDLTLVQHGDSFLIRQTTLPVIKNTEKVCLALLRTYSRSLMFCAAVASLSGPGGVVLRKFDYSTGQLILEKRLRSLHESRHLDTGDFGDGTAITFVEESQDVVALTNGHIVQRIEGTGRVPWVWESPDKT